MAASPTSITVKLIDLPQIQHLLHELVDIAQRHDGTDASREILAAIDRAMETD